MKPNGFQYPPRQLHRFTIWWHYSSNCHLKHAIILPIELSSTSYYTWLTTVRASMVIAAAEAMHVHAVTCCVRVLSVHTDACDFLLLLINNVSCLCNEQNADIAIFYMY